MGIAPENVTHLALLTCAVSAACRSACKRYLLADSAVLIFRCERRFTRYCDDCHSVGTGWLTMIISLSTSDEMLAAAGPYESRVFGNPKLTGTAGRHEMTGEDRT
jgi:hypothetical protein